MYFYSVEITAVIGKECSFESMVYAEYVDYEIYYIVLQVRYIFNMDLPFYLRFSSFI